MAIHYKQLHFACPPFTGATWFIRACQLAGFGPAFHHRAYGVFEDWRGKDSLRVSLVRHPCDWIAHCYGALKQDRETINYVGCFSRLPLESFDQFVEEYLRRHAGEVGRLFHRYEANTVMRLEDMPGAFLELMDSIGVNGEFAELSKRLLPPYSKSPLPKWNSTLRSGVIRAEKAALEEYDYW